MRMYECVGTKWYGLLTRRSKWTNICVRGIKKKKRGSNKYEIGMIWYSVAKITITKENVWFNT